MIEDFGITRVDTAVTRAIDNGGEFPPAIGTLRKFVPSMDSSRQFQACERDGCLDGWRPGGKTKAGDPYVIRCQCFLDWAKTA